MDYEEAKRTFIQTWGSLGSQWGTNRTMAQIHALLLLSPEALSTEDIMKELNISRGNANMNVRTLIDWGIVRKELKPGERMEYFVAIKDIWEVARRVSRERRRRELEPMMQAVSELKALKDDGRKKEVQELKKIVADVSEFSGNIDSMLVKFEKSDNNWFTRTFMKLLQ
ncbi:MAG: transcriptional regulator [Flavobacteriales bacterium]|nr:transcriptional regulator [Flavobacteriales bacterium]